MNLIQKGQREEVDLSDLKARLIASGLVARQITDAEWSRLVASGYCNQFTSTAPAPEPTRNAYGTLGGFISWKENRRANAKANLRNAILSRQLDFYRRAVKETPCTHLDSPATLSQPSGLGGSADR